MREIFPINDYVAARLIKKHDSSQSTIIDPTKKDEFHYQISDYDESSKKISDVQKKGRVGIVRGNYIIPKPYSNIEVVISGDDRIYLFKIDDIAAIYKL